MKIKKISLTKFKRFTDLTVEMLPETARLVVLVGPNGSGKSSFLEAMNHYYKYSGYENIGDYRYLSKEGNEKDFSSNEWWNESQRLVNIDFHDVTYENKIGRGNIRGHFYFRSAYRNEPKFNIDTMKRLPDPTEIIRLDSLMQNDQTVSSNYQRLVANSITALYDENNNCRTVQDLRDELVGKIKKSLGNVFDDLDLTSIGNPLKDGNFYFTKGQVKDFSYQNLSAGEKSAFDLILDLVVQSVYYNDAIYCIDEPEIHMHTKLQGRVLRELYCLIPEKSQLWISTHSIGMLHEAQIIEKENPGTVVFLDFGDRDYDESQVIQPAHIDKAFRNKFYELAFGDFSTLLLPQIIVFCEGDQNGKSRKNFDQSIYSKIFEQEELDISFISAGSCSEIETIENRLGEVMTRILSNTRIVKIIDRDDRSQEEINDLNAKGITVLKRRHIESYLLDDEVIKKLCIVNNQPEKVEQCIQIKNTALQNVMRQGKPCDDIKSARGEIYNEIKKTLSLVACGNSADSFLRDTITPLITSDLNVYKELKEEIIGE